MRKIGVRGGVIAVLLLALSACGTRLPSSAFENAGTTGGTAAGAARPAAKGSAQAGAGAAQSTASAGATDPTAAAAGGSSDGGAAAQAAGGGPGGADGPNQASDVGVTETEIHIGNITAQDGILGDAFKPGILGLQAFVDYTNDHGGVHGRKLVLDACNDKEDRTRAMQCAQDLVENKNVFAFVANNSRAEGGAAPYIDGKGVPVLDIPITNAAYRWPHYWTIYGTACPRDGQHVCGNDQMVNTTEIYRWFKQNMGASKAAVFYYTGVAESEQAASFMQTGLQLEGFQVTKYGATLGNPAFDQAVQDMKTNGTDAIFDALDDGANRKLCDTMQSYGVQVKAKVSTVVAYGDEIGNDFSQVCRSAYFIGGSSVSYSATDNPAVATFRSAYDTYQPGAPLQQWALEGWASGQMLVDYLNAAGAAPTRAGFEQWLGALDGYTYDGLFAPISFKPVDVNAPQKQNSCYTVAQWNDGNHAWAQRANECITANQFRTPASERGD